MTNPVLWALSTRPKGNFYVRRVDKWTNFCPRRMPYFNTIDMQCTKLESGLPVHNPSK